MAEPPQALSLAQANFFDGVRLSCEVAAVAFHRLRENLLTLSREQLAGGESDEARIPAAIGDAWQIVDAVNRARNLLSRFPGLKGKHSTGAQIFEARTELAKDFRDDVQHVQKWLPQLASGAERALGTLHWHTTWPEGVNSPFFAFRLIPGWVGGAVHSLIVELPERPAAPIDRIILDYRGRSLDLGAMWAAVGDLRQGLADALLDMKVAPGTIQMFRAQAWLVGQRPSAAPPISSLGAD